MAFFDSAIEILRQLFVNAGTDLFLDGIAKTHKGYKSVDCKAKGQKVKNYKIRPPSRPPNGNKVNEYDLKRDKIN